MGTLVYFHVNNNNRMYILVIFIIVFYTIGYLNEKDNDRLNQNR